MSAGSFDSVRIFRTSEEKGARSLELRDIQKLLRNFKQFLFFQNSESE